MAQTRGDKVLRDIYEDFHAKVWKLYRKSRDFSNDDDEEIQANVRSTLDLLDGDLTYMFDIRKEIKSHLLGSSSHVENVKRIRKEDRSEMDFDENTSEFFSLSSLF